jgi:diguanylate cyclase (GGDEF)-like protein
MKLRSSTTLIAFGLACLTLSLVLIANSLGIAPDQTQALLRSRMQTVELAAAQCSPVAAAGDMQTLKSIAQRLAAGNPDLASAGIRKADGKLVWTFGDHARLWTDEQSSQAPWMKLAVPILTAGGDWGTLEFAYRRPILPMPGFVPLGIATLLSNPVLRIGGFLFAAGFLAYSFYLRRTLRHLDPSSVIPPRVRAMLDSLTEGVAVLDRSGRIVLANDAFGRSAGESAERLQGRRADQLSWLEPRTRQRAKTFPWAGALASGRTTKAVTLCLGEQTDSVREANDPIVPVDYTQRIFSVNASPILAPTGQVRGALVTVDDVTEVERMNLLLTESRDEIQRSNDQLRILATIDPLTECLNRRSFLEKFEALFAQIPSQATALGCVMVDVDRFKNINDRFGHTVGDTVLKSIARILQAGVGSDGFVCRYGGEEFCVLLPGCYAAQTERFAEILRKAIESEKWSIAPITASLGVSSSELGAPDVKSLLDQADAALYSSKRHGRNRVTLWAGSTTQAAEKRTSMPGGEDLVMPRALHDPAQQAAFVAMFTTFACQRPTTAIHCRQVADLCLQAAPGLLSATEALELEVAALLHDIGKVGVPDEILHNPGLLTPEEWEVLRNRDHFGVHITTAAGMPESTVKIIALLQLPYNPAAETAPTQRDPIRISARLLAIADAFDAMISDRPHQPAKSREDAFAELRRCAGEKFNPAIVSHFVDALTKSADRSGLPRHAA